jgi:hypothetical protein
MCSPDPFRQNPMTLAERHMKIDFPLRVSLRVLGDWLGFSHNLHLAIPIEYS